MSVHFDTVIIGAGPSGIAAAITLQKNCITNAVIDKSIFPRAKTCGGLVTEKTLNVLMNLFDTEDPGFFSEIICDRNRLVELYYKDNILTSSETDTDLFFVRRDVFDNFLVERYRGSGGRFFEGETKYIPDFENNTIILSCGDRISYDHLFIADGALSLNARKMDYKLPKPGFCIETHIPKKNINISEGVKIFFGIVKDGYAWCFPSGDDYCIGLGGVYKKKNDYKNKLDGLLGQLGVDPAKAEYKGAFVPYGKTTAQNAGPENVLLLGDAAGFVDPISGEGLYFALSSGIEAAESRAGYEKGRETIKDIYLNKTSDFSKIIKQGNILRKRLFSPVILGIFKNKIKNKDYFVSFYCDKQISKYTYDYSRLSGIYRDYRKEKKKRIY